MAYEIPYECICCGGCMERCPARAIHPENGMYVIDAAKCIDCGICRETCPYTLPYHVGPEDTSLHRKRVYFIDDGKCIGCSACSRKCPVGAISGELRKSYTIDQALCIGCGRCAAACRKDAVFFEGESMPDLPLSINPEKCIRCNLCKANCPADAIIGSLVPKFVVDFYDVYKPPYEIDPEKCLRCGICQTWCTQDAIAPAEADVVAARHAFAEKSRARVPVQGSEHTLGI